ncbi:MAG TPA: hypothetical protein VHQ95_23350, partial [Pyrinomonadaceae bacterium]|nr:hypothetical protein [Pyrinomonadaceae bacterium]
IEVPAPTAWPMITALGIALLAAGLVTHLAVGMLGLILAMRGAVGWFREDLPVQHVEFVPVRPELERAQPVKVSARTVVHLTAGQASHRVRIPAEIHPYSSGLKGGIVGGVAMAIVASAYGLIFHSSIWYPINLLAAAAMPSLAQADPAQLKAFNGVAFIMALISHGVISLLVGLLFAVLLPMLPSKRAAFWGSLMAPLLWTALVWATLRLVNPLLDARIDWVWFIASQIVFGMTAGYIVHHSGTVETMQTWPLAARAGLEVPGLLDEKEEE